MMFRGITAYYFENNNRHKNTLWQNTKFVLQQVLHSYHYVLDGYNFCFVEKEGIHARYQLKTSV